MSKLNKLFLQNPKAFKNVVLTEHQTDILKLVIAYNITTVDELVTVADIPVCTAGMQMKTFVDKGYLTRKASPETSRGNRSKYVYAIHE